MPKSPREVRREVQEAVAEQVRDLPVQAVRLAMFGVGRALLLTDRVTRDVREIRESGVRPVLGRLKDDAEHIAGQIVGKVVDRVNGGQDDGAVTTLEREKRDKPEERETPVARPPQKPQRPVRPRPPAQRAELSVGKPKPSSAEAFSEVEPATPLEVVPEPAAEPEPAPPAAAPKAELPVPDYDTATLASVRARLRALSAPQVSALRDYEAAHAARPEFVRMFENRIAKLTGGS